MWREPLTGNTGENTGSHNLSTKRQRIAKLARTKRGVAFHLRDFLDRRVRDGVNDNIRERNSSMKNRKRELGGDNYLGRSATIIWAGGVGRECRLREGRSLDRRPAFAGDGGFKIPWRGRPLFGVEGGIAAHSTNRMRSE